MIRIIKFSDEAAIVDTSDSDVSFERSVDAFVTWCDNNHLELNVGKTKEMLVDFQRDMTHVAPLMLKDQTVEIVEQYK